MINKIATWYFALSFLTAAIVFLSMSKSIAALFLMLASVFYALTAMGRIPEKYKLKSFKSISGWGIGIIFIGIILMSVGRSHQAQSMSSTVGSTPVTQNQPKELKEEIPPPNVCAESLGVFKISPDGRPIKKIAQYEILLKYVKNDECGIIELSYALVGSYGDPIPMKITYSRATGMLKEIFTRTNVVNEYSNVSPESLIEFLKSNKRAFEYLTDYADVKYNFNTREIKNEAVGPRPEQSDWDGSVSIVKEYIKANAVNASSVNFLEWSKVMPSDKYWVVRCKYSGKNSFGAEVTNNAWFFIQNGAVVKTK